MAKKKLETRRKLIDAALALSSEKGFSAISLRELAKEAGISPTAFYRHFNDMEELGLQLIDEVGLSLRKLLREHRRQPQHQRSMVRDSVESFVKYIVENNNLFRLMLGERQGGSPAFRRALFSEMGRFIEEMSIDLERIHNEMNRPLNNADLAAEAIVSITFALGGEVLDSPKHKRSEVTERMIKLVNIIFKGAFAKN